MVQEFHKVMKLHFTIIKVKKYQEAITKEKLVEISIFNEIKLITASNEIHDLWKDWGYF